MVAFGWWAGLIELSAHGTEQASTVAALGLLAHLVFLGGISPIFEASGPLQVQGQLKHVAQTSNQVIRVEGVDYGLVDGHTFLAGTRLGTVLGCRVGIPEAQGEQNHFASHQSRR